MKLKHWELSRESGVGQWESGSGSGSESAGVGRGGDNCTTIINRCTL